MSSIIRSFLSPLLLATLFFSVGCAGPCDDLVEVGCENAGQESPSCKRLRERAERVSPDDKRACSVALELVENLEKAR